MAGAQKRRAQQDRQARASGPSSTEHNTAVTGQHTPPSPTASPASQHVSPPARPPPQLDGNRDPDDAPNSPEATGARRPAIVVDGRPLFDLGGSAWSVIHSGVLSGPNVMPKRPSYNTLGKEVLIGLNSFLVRDYPTRKIYQYDVLVGSGGEKRGLIDKVWNSKAVKEATGKGFIFDGNKIAWGPKKFDGPKTVNVNLDVEQGRPIRADKPNVWDIRLTPTREISFDLLRGYLEGKCDLDQPVFDSMNFLDHLLRETPRGKFTQIRSSFFARSKDGRALLGGGVEAFKGVFASIRPVGTLQGAKLAVNVDVSNGTFFTESLIHLTAREICNAPDVHDLARKLAPVMEGGRPKESAAFQNLRRLHKVQFSTPHRGNESPNNKNTLRRFVNKNALEVTFNWKHDGKEETISVANYYEKRYNIRLQYPRLPVIEAKKETYFPMELCKISQNQRYTYKLDDKQTSNMIKFAVTPPQERWRAIEEGVRMLNWGEDMYLKNYGLNIDPKPQTIKARLLKPPAVDFEPVGNKRTSLEVGTAGKWDLRNKKFFRHNATALEVWGVAIIQGRGGASVAQVQQFLRSFIQGYKAHGGLVKEERPEIIECGRDTGKAVEDIWTACEKRWQRRAQMLVFIVPDKEAFAYHRIKKSCDCRYGVVSQVMQSAHVLRGQPQYISNVCMKFNAKLGGVTARAGPGSAFNEPTMVIGADVSHAAPGSLSPSMAAITISNDKEAIQYLAACETNGHRVEMITTDNWEKLLKPMVRDWMSNLGGGNLPKQLYYFRDGVSESQYPFVLQDELRDIRRVLKEVGGDISRTKITVIVASKRHHVRFFPKPGDKNASDRNGNPLPGTLVESGVTHPTEFDWYLCSHSAIKGTARPVHYYVLLNESGKTPNQMQQFIYEHSYQYVRSTTPVSLFPAVYYAHLASNRARSHEAVPSSSGPPSKITKDTKDKADAIAKATADPNAKAISRPSQSNSDSQSRTKKDDIQCKPLLPMVLDSRIHKTMWYV